MNKKKTEEKQQYLQYLKNAVKTIKSSSILNLIYNKMKKEVRDLNNFTFVLLF